jgi:hypothetical protein
MLLPVSGRFWIFMNRVSPFTYFVSSVLSTGLSGTTVECSSIAQSALLQINHQAPADNLPVEDQAKREHELSNVAASEEPDTGSNIAQFMFSLCLVFNG